QSDSYPGPKDHKPVPPRWAFPHLTDEEYKRMIASKMSEGGRVMAEHCPSCGSESWFDLDADTRRCDQCGHEENPDRTEKEALRARITELEKALEGVYGALVDAGNVALADVHDLRMAEKVRMVVQDVAEKDARIAAAHGGHECAGPECVVCSGEAAKAYASGGREEVARLRALVDDLLALWERAPQVSMGFAGECFKAYVGIATLGSLTERAEALRGEGGG
ncbi:MAG: hypothetical protein ACYTGV_20455, partial [Planctomycetota bacterium]